MPAPTKAPDGEAAGSQTRVITKRDKSNHLVAVDPASAGSGNASAPAAFPDAMAESPSIAASVVTTLGYLLTDRRRDRAHPRGSGSKTARGWPKGIVSVDAGGSIDISGRCMGR